MPTTYLTRKAAQEAAEAALGPTCNAFHIVPVIGGHGWGFVVDDPVPGFAPDALNYMPPMPETASNLEDMRLFLEGRWPGVTKADDYNAVADAVALLTVTIAQLAFAVRARREDTAAGDRVIETGRQGLTTAWQLLLAPKAEP